MATARPFAYNPGTTIPGTEQLGNLSIGYPTSGFTNSPQYWNGPDEELGYVIAQAVPDNSQPTPLSGVTASVGFYRSESLTEISFIELSETISGQQFASGAQALTWLNNNGYWTSYTPPPESPTPTPTPTNTPTPSVTNTQTPTNTPTPTVTNTQTPTNTPTPTVTNTPTNTTTPTNTPSSGIDAIRAALSTSVAAYDAATVGNFIKVTQAEYTNVFATVAGTTKYVMNDTDLNSAANGWSTGFNISYDDTINSIGSIPINNYIIGYAYRGNSSGEVTTYLRTGTTANGIHTKIGANVNYTDIGAKTVYFIRKAPPTATTSKVYLSFFMNGIALGQVSGKSNYPIYYSSGINTNTWTNFTGGYPTFQSLATTTKSW